MNKKVKIDVLVVGSCNIDMHWFTPTLPLPGQTILGTKCEKGFGGKGANEAVAASRLGGTTALIAMVGDDSHGKEYIEHLRANNILTDYIGISPSNPTGMACVTIDKSGENFIVVIPGANFDLTPERLNTLFKNRASPVQDHTQLAPIMGAKVLVTQREVPEAVVLESLKWAKGHYCSSEEAAETTETVTIFNPSPIREDERDKLYNSHILDFCDILCLNEVEASILTKQLPHDPTLNCEPVTWDVQNGANTNTNILETCKVAVVKLMQVTKVQAVILTLGKHGVLFAERDCPGTVKHVMSPKVEAIDTSGAGDSFLGSIAYYYALYPHLDLHQKINRACYISAQTVKKRGTQASYPRRTSLPAFLF